MAENPHFLPPTNQLFQQITHNNYPIPNNIPQQLVGVENQINPLGFQHFYHHNQEQQQRRIWVERQLSNSHYQLQGRERTENGLTNNNNAASSVCFPPHSVNYGVGYNGNYGKVGGTFGEEEEKEDETLVRGSEQFGLEGGNGNLTAAAAQCWQRDSLIKKPPSFGRPVITELLSANNKRCMEPDEMKEEVYNHNKNKRFKCPEESLLVAKPARRNLEDNVDDNDVICEASAIEQPNKTNQEPVEDESMAINTGSIREEELRGDENEKAEEEKMRDSNSTQIESSMADFFISLVNRVTHNQDILHQRFLQTIERLDEERKEREETWRKQDLARLNQLANDRARDQALASSREAVIVSYLEKITGQSIIIPKKTQEAEVAETMNVNKRWPKVEVEGLIRIRTSLEPKFLDPALKAFVWEEISNLMGSMGYRRSAQRCKEKWENINRYYKKAKENSKGQGLRKFKTCPYFQQLDQFYSFTHGSGSSSSSFSSLLHDRNLHVEEIQEHCNIKDDKKLNHLIELNKDEDNEEDDEDEEEGSDVD